MATQQQKKSSGTDRVASLAEKLFIANWQPHSNRTESHLAQQCRDAAEAFYRQQQPKSEAA